MIIFKVLSLYRSYFSNNKITKMFYEKSLNFNKTPNHFKTKM